VALSGPDLLQYGIFLIVATVLVKRLGGYMARVFDRQPTFLDGALLPVERLTYGLTGIEPDVEMDWKQYSIAFVLLGLVGTVLLAIRSGGTLKFESSPGSHFLALLHLHVTIGNRLRLLGSVQFFA
jgi:K+-transporting ATPase A subunit